MITIKSQLLKLIVSHGKEEAPIEACGVLAGKKRKVNGRTIKEVFRVYPCTNELRSPIEYQISPEEQFSIFSEIDDMSLDLLGFYHSHPSAPSRPSLIDEERANYEGYSYLIIALHPLKVSSWVLERRGTFTQEELEVIP